MRFVTAWQKNAHGSANRWKLGRRIGGTSIGGIKAATGEPGLKFTMDFGMGALNALNLGDVMNDVTNQIRPFEVHAGRTDQVVGECMAYLTERTREREVFEIMQRSPGWVRRRLDTRKGLRNTLTTLGKVQDHLRGPQTRETLHEVRDRLSEIEVDRLRVKPTSRSRANSGRRRRKATAISGCSRSSSAKARR